jgi:hypothetical protein
MNPVKHFLQSERTMITPLLYSIQLMKRTIEDKIMRGRFHLLNRLRVIGMNLCAVGYRSEVQTFLYPTVQIILE